MRKAVHMWTPNAFGDAHAKIYDELVGNLPDTAETVDALCSAEGTTLLEFGLGTGRLAIPLAARGMQVTSIEISQKMIEMMRLKEGADKVTVRQGDYTYLDLEERFDIVLLSRNALVASPDQNLQVAIMQSAARHLGPSGRVYVDLGMPRPWASSGVNFDRALDDGAVLYQRYLNSVTQQIDFRRIIIRNNSVDVMSRNTRYIWPSELDLMARLAGLRLTDRWSNWHGAEVTEASEAFISVYARADADQ